MSPRISSILTAFAMSTLITLSTVTDSSAGWGASATFAGSPLDLVNAVNALRSSSGLAPYRISSILMYSAQSQADFLAATGTMTHTGPDGSGLTDRLLAAGYPLVGELSAGGFRAENITSGSESMSAQSAVEQWAGDALHLDTMLSPNLTEIGAGVALSNGKVYYVIDCAHPTTSAEPDASPLVATRGSTAVAPGTSMAVVIVSTPNSNGEVIHDVQFAQTLWGLAIAYNVKIEEIRGLNDLLDNSIYPGTKLLIKKGMIQGTAAPPETPAGDLTVTSIITPISTATIIQPTLTSTQHDTPSPPPLPARTNTIIGAIIGIVALALLGGRLFTWLGSSKK